MCNKAIPAFFAAFMLATVFLQTADISFAIGQAISPVPGLAPAFSLLSAIVKSCENVILLRKRAEVLANRSRYLVAALEKEARGLEATTLQDCITEVEQVLVKTLICTRAWQKRSSIKRWLLQGAMDQEIGRCIDDVDNTVESLKLRCHLRTQNKLEIIIEQITKLSRDKDEVQRVANLHQAGGLDARNLMEGGQKVLDLMRPALQNSTSISTSDPSPSYIPNQLVTAQKYHEVQQGLAMLQRATALVPENKILDGCIKKNGEFPIAGGSSCEIWRGVWFEDIEVALKAIRNVKADDKIAQKGFIREIDVWSKLNNKHILRFIGIATDVGTQIHIVSPWLKNGSVLEFIKENPTADRMSLIRGAAEGLAYLHSQNVVHGNIKCANILVSDSGDARLCDFGMAKVIEDVTTTPACTTLTSSGSTRWLAPEVIEGNRPSQPSDVYSFGMAVLEMLTEKIPFPQLKSDFAVIRALIGGARPSRPIDPSVQCRITDGLWALLQQCWYGEIDSRPTMENVMTELKAM